MNKGRIEQIADPETLYTRPASPFVCRFLGEVNELPAALHARWTGIDDDGVVAFVRPHDLDLQPLDGGSGARVESVRDLGASMAPDAGAHAREQPVHALVLGDHRIATGGEYRAQDLRVAFDAVTEQGDARELRFPPQGGRDLGRGLGAQPEIEHDRIARPQRQGLPQPDSPMPKPTGTILRHRRRTARPPRRKTLRARSIASLTRSQQPRARATISRTSCRATCRGRRNCASVSTICRGSSIS